MNSIFWRSYGHRQTYNGTATNHAATSSVAAPHFGVPMNTHVGTGAVVGTHMPVGNNRMTTPWIGGYFTTNRHNGRTVAGGVAGGGGVGGNGGVQRLYNRSVEGDSVGHRTGAAAADRPAPPPTAAAAGPAASPATPTPLAERLGVLQTHFAPEVVEAYVSPPPAPSVLIPHDALLEALVRCPHLVRKEKPIEEYVEFLCGERTTKDPGTLRRAASLLALYWEVRKHVFEGRAFLPLRMTTESFEGALNEQDLDVLNTGFITLAPASADGKGRSCYIADARKLSYRHCLPHYFKARERVTFYIGHAPSLDPSTKIHGMVWITVVTGKVPSHNMDRTKRMFEVSCVPRVEWHGLFLPSILGTVRTFFMSLCVFLLKGFSRLDAGTATTNTHFGITDDSVFGKFLQASKLNPADLPTCVGGRIKDRSYFQKWKRQQLAEETAIYEGYEELARRQKVAARSQHKRDRERHKVQALRRQANELGAANETLKGDNRKLETLLKYAETEVDVLEELDEYGCQADGDGNRSVLEPLPSMCGEPPLNPYTVFGGDSDDDGETIPSGTLTYNSDGKPLEDPPIALTDQEMLTFPPDMVGWEAERDTAD